MEKNCNREIRETLIFLQRLCDNCKGKGDCDYCRAKALNKAGYRKVQNVERAAYQRAIYKVLDTWRVHRKAVILGNESFEEILASLLEQTTVKGKFDK